MQLCRVCPAGDGVIDKEFCGEKQESFEVKF